jgi:hypothetical protein
MSKNELVPVYQVESLPDLAPSMDVFRGVIQNSTFLQRIQLYTKGKYVDLQLIGPGHYGVPVSEDNIEDLGTEIDVIPFAWRPKAIDMADRDNVIVSYDSQSPEYQRMKKASDEEDNSHCMYGVCFLVFERNKAQFYELFFGTASGRRESTRFLSFCPISPAAAAQISERTGKTVEARGPLPCTLKAKYITKGSWGWHVPVSFQCTTPFTNLPPIDVVTDEIKKFYALKSGEVEKVEEAPATKRRAR